MENILTIFVNYNRYILLKQEVVFKLKTFKQDMSGYIILNKGWFMQTYILNKSALITIQKNEFLYSLKI